MYGIYKTQIEERCKWDQAKLADEIKRAYLVMTESDFETAVWLAQECAREHAERIEVELSTSGNGHGPTGATFVTNNGTRVWYTAKELKS